MKRADHDRTRQKRAGHDPGTWGPTAGCEKQTCSALTLTINVGDLTFAFALDLLLAQLQ